MTRSGTIMLARVKTSGALPWRIGRDGNPEVLLVHRRNQDDWSIPKGKAEPGESDADCALREVREETGFDCRPGAELPHVVYLDRTRRVKTVRYWAVTVDAGVFAANDEVDDARWLALPLALRTLTQARERPVVLALGALVAKELGVCPVPAKERMLLLVRGAAALPREQWEHSENDRPLASEGRSMARSLVDLGSFFEIDRILSAPAARCMETVEPLARSETLSVEASADLSDGRIGKAMRLIEDARGIGTVLCTHEDVVSGVLTELAKHDRTSVEPHPGRRRGSVWALTGDHARYTSAYYLPLPELSSAAASDDVMSPARPVAIGSAEVTAEEEDRAVAHVIDRLAEKFPDMPRSTVERAVHERRAALAGNPVRAYIPVLIERGARELLRESPRSGPSV